MEEKTRTATKPLKAWRKDRGWTQQQLADAAGVHVNTVQNIERHAHRPFPVVQRTIAAALDVEGARVQEFG